MLLVKTYIDKSPIHGIGLFAGEFIPKGTIIWKLEKDFDVIITNEVFNKLPKLTQDYIMFYSYYDETINSHVLCSDHARFFNKAEEPNCVGDDGTLYGNTMAVRDIQIGEELTEIYFNLNELESLDKH